jgi:putative transposase
MPDYRRWRAPGGTYFFTINLLERRSDLLVRRIDALREAVRRTGRERPFHIDAWVVLPEHTDCIITLPEGNDDFSNRIKAIKIRCVRATPATERRSKTRVARSERGIWQRHSWEHAIRSDADYSRHMDYVHFNPAKHGHVTFAVDWPWSTFHRLVKVSLRCAPRRAKAHSPRAVRTPV